MGKHIPAHRKIYNAAYFRSRFHHPCAISGCSKLATRKATFCPDHEPGKTQINHYIYVQQSDAYKNIGKERRIVQTNLARANRANLPATLTLEQWIFTLEYFHWKCAYCHVREYMLFEHFIPVKLGGGTTKDNCVPACYGCNTRKREYHPLTDPSLSTRDDIKQVYKYLKGLREKKATQLTLFYVK